VKSKNLTRNRSSFPHQNEQFDRYKTATGILYASRQRLFRRNSDQTLTYGHSNVNVSSVYYFLTKFVSWKFRILKEKRIFFFKTKKKGFFLKATSSLQSNN